MEEKEAINVSYFDTYPFESMRAVSGLQGVASGCKEGYLSRPKGFNVLSFQR